MPNAPSSIITCTPSKARSAPAPRLTPFPTPPGGEARGRGVSAPRPGTIRPHAPSALKQPRRRRAPGQPAIEPPRRPRRPGPEPPRRPAPPAPDRSRTRPRRHPSGALLTRSPRLWHARPPPHPFATTPGVRPEAEGAAPPGRAPAARRRPQRPSNRAAAAPQVSPRSNRPAARDAPVLNHRAAPRHRPLTEAEPALLARSPRLLARPPRPSPFPNYSGGEARGRGGSAPWPGTGRGRATVPSGTTSPAAPRRLSAPAAAPPPRPRSARGRTGLPPGTPSPRRSPAGPAS